MRPLPADGVHQSGGIAAQARETAQATRAPPGDQLEDHADRRLRGAAQVGKAGLARHLAQARLAGYAPRPSPTSCDSECGVRHGRGGVGSSAPSTSRGTPAPSATSSGPPASRISEAPRNGADTSVPVRTERPCQRPHSVLFRENSSRYAGCRTSRTSSARVLPADTPVLQHLFSCGIDLSFSAS